MAGRYARRVDGNQKRTATELRKRGFTVAFTHMVGGGFPDFMVGRWGVTLPVELKDPSKPPSQRKLTKPEEAWHGAWKGSVIVAETADEIDQFMRGLRK